MKLPQATDNPRRKPSQARAVATVDTILEAVAQILESEDAARFNTNRVAERAGYSVATLYQYFPNKQSLLRALVTREIDRQDAALRALLQSEPDLPADALLRGILRGALRPFDDRRRLRRALVDILFTERDIVGAAMRIGERLMPLLLARLADGGETPAVGPIARDATLGAIIGAIVTLARRDPDILHSEAVEDELVRLLLHGLRAPTPG